MRKYILTLTAIAALTTAPAYSAVKVGLGFDQGFGVTAQFNNINAFIGNDGAAVDYVFQRGNFGDDVPLNWYVAGGAFLGWDHGAGVRLPLGVSMAFNSKWDAYLQVHPQLDFDHGAHSDTHFNLDAGIGVRYRF